MNFFDHYVEWKAQRRKESRFVSMRILKYCIYINMMTFGQCLVHTHRRWVQILEPGEFHQMTHQFKLPLASEDTYGRGEPNEIFPRSKKRITDLPDNRYRV